MKTKREALGLNYWFYRTRCIVVALLVVVTLQNAAWSRSTFTPTIQVIESFVSNESPALKESGQITTISPGIRYDIIGSKSNFSMNYALNAFYYNNLPRQNTIDHSFGIHYDVTGSKSNLVLDYALNAFNYNSLSRQDKTDHSLSLKSNIVHTPNWDTQITGTIKRENFSADGVQISNPQFQLSNDQELRTFGVITNLKGKLTRSLDYQSSLDADYASFKNSGNTNSTGINLGLSNNPQSKVSWSSSLSSRQSTNTSNVSSRVDTLSGAIDYKFNRQYSTFLTLSKSETNNSFLNKTISTIGVRWTPNNNTLLSLAVGKRGDDATYMLDSSTTSQRITYKLNYSESVTTPRALTIAQANNQTNLTAANQGLSTTPVLLKIGQIGMVITGNKSVVDLSYFHQTTTQSTANASRDIRQGLNLTASRALSSISSIQLAASRQKSETSQSNTVDDFTIGYSRQVSPKLGWSVDLRDVSQSSSVAANESTQRRANFSLNATF